MVYILDRHGNPLMPTERHGKVRRMLRTGLAHVVKRTPFTIQLGYITESNVQPVNLGIDAGTTHIGLSATTSKKELYAAELLLRTDIVQKIASRRENRRTRRSRLRYRAPRFNNRLRRDGWIAPSLVNKVDTHLKAILEIHRILPITKTTIEVAQFDTSKMKYDLTSNIDLGKDRSQSFWNIREYVFARDGYKCQCCKGKSKNPILNVHHIESRRIGGNSPGNLITLCESCHKDFHQGEIHLNIKRSKSLRDAAVMNIMRWEVYNRAKNIFRNVHLTYGYITKNTRIKYGIGKSHIADARCISKNPLATPLSFYFLQKQIRRHNRQIHKSKILKGGHKKLNQCSYVVKGFRLYDKVGYEGKECFVIGRRSNGSFAIRLLDGTKVHDGINSKKLQFLETKRTILISFQKHIVTPEGSR